MCLLSPYNAPATLTVQAAPAGLANYPVVPSIRGSVASTVRHLIAVGKRKGNRLNVFSKVGDSITAFGFFLVPVGNGGLRVGDHPEVMSAVSFFTKTVARTNNSFANDSIAAHPAWTTNDLLNPANATPGLCVNTTPLDCELGVTKPAVALIMIGTNDLSYGDINGFRANLNKIVDITESHGVVPVLSTLPLREDRDDALNRVDAYNSVIASVATSRAVPLWNYWLAMQNLPAHGISTDKIHPSVPPDQNTAIFDGDHLAYGFPVRNLTALQVLNALLPLLR